jgi:hypothetical protein
VADLLLTPGIKPAADGDPNKITLRTADKFVPLFWWGLFKRENIVQYKQKFTDWHGAQQETETLALTADSKRALQRLNEFASGMNAFEAIATVGRSCIQELMDPVKQAHGSSIQLDFSDHDLDFKILKEFIEKGCAFADQICAGLVKDLDWGVETFLSSSAIEVNRVQQPVNPNDFAKPDDQTIREFWRSYPLKAFEDRIENLEGLVLPPSPYVHGELSPVHSWEYSLLGEKSYEFPNALPARQWWQVWK